MRLAAAVHCLSDASDPPNEALPVVWRGSYAKVYRLRVTFSRASLSLHCVSFIGITAGAESNAKDCPSALLYYLLQLYRSRRDGVGPEQSRS